MEMETQHMSPYISVTVMVIASIIIGYFITMNVLINVRNNITDNLLKIYQSLLMGFLMGAIEIGMIIFILKLYDFFYIMLLLILLLISAILVYVIYYQIGINENQFMLAMIEHHSMALQMVNGVKPKTTDPELLSIMDEILESQQREIDQMKNILERRNISLKILT